MSDQPQGPGWWQASDGKYYPPQSATGAAGPPAATAAPAEGEAPAPKKPIYKRWWFWLIAAILVLIIAVALSGGGGTADETSDDAAPVETPDAAEEEAEATTDSDDAAQEAEEAPEEDQEAASGPDGSRENPLPLGEAGTVGEWTVSVDEINTDANQLVADANEFNEPPEQGQYVLLTLTVTYNGSDEGSPAFDLLEVMVVDGVQYSDADAFAVAPDPSQTNAPTLENGGTVTFNAVLDVPTADGAALFVEETLSFDDNKVYWAVP